MAKANSTKQDIFGRDIPDNGTDDIVDDVVGHDSAFFPVWVPRSLMLHLEPMAQELGCMPHELFTVVVAFGVSHREELFQYIERMKRKNHEGR